MTDHYERALEQTARMEELHAAINKAHTARERQPHVIAQLNAELGNAKALATVHSMLSVRQALDELRLPL